MKVTVIGQKGDGPIMQRTVTPRQFFKEWGPYADFLFQNAREETVVIDGHKVRVVLR